MMQSPILLVEDDENDVFFLRRALGKAGVSNPLHVARDGEEAIGYVSASKDRGSLPVLLVLDLNLPVKHGLQVLSWIRGLAERPAIAVVVLTSSTSELDMREAYQLGANSYLVKPGDPDKLCELVALIKSYWLGVNQLPPLQG